MRSARSAWVRGRRGWLRATGATAAVEMHSVGVHAEGEAALTVDMSRASMMLTFHLSKQKSQMVLTKSCEENLNRVNSKLLTRGNVRIISWRGSILKAFLFRL